MQSESTIDLPSLTIRNGILVLDGYGLRVSVERGHLEVADGICETRRRARFARATSDLRRLVVLGHTGSITLEALRWLKDVGVAFVQIDTNGQVVVASAPAGLDNARLRRAQAIASSSGVGMQVGRELVRRKLEGQLAVVTRLPNGPPAAAVIRNNLAILERATTPARLRLVEADAAAAYWKTWEHIPVRFVRRDEARIPDHWRTFGVRTSPLSRSPRLAANPPSAILNYLFAILEAEARIAALKMGLDPGMGVLHADQPARDSLALDLMEPVRPDVEGYVLELLQRQTFRAADFFETRQGVCRVLPPLTHILAETAPSWAARVGLVAELVARMFAGAASTNIIQIPTLLTQDNRSRGRDKFRRQARTRSRMPSVGPAVCLDCGTVLEKRGRLYCADCLPARRALVSEPLRKAGAAAVRNHIAMGHDPTHGGRAAKRRGLAVSQHLKAVGRWNREHRYEIDPQIYRQDILPRLASVPLSRLMEATGLSLRYCSLIRRGERTPHPRHWDTLERVGRISRGD